MFISLLCLLFHSNYIGCGKKCGKMKRRWKIIVEIEMEEWKKLMDRSLTLLLQKLFAILAKMSFLRCNNYEFLKTGRDMHNVFYMLKT
jgi:hypothetical protein